MMLETFNSVMFNKTADDRGNNRQRNVIDKEELLSVS